MIQDQLSTFCTNLAMGAASVTSNAIPIALPAATFKDGGADPFGGQPLYLHIHITETFAGAAAAAAAAQFLLVCSTTATGVGALSAQAQVIASTALLETNVENAGLVNLLTAGQHFYVSAGPMARGTMDKLQTLLGDDYAGNLFLFVACIKDPALANFAAGKFSADLVETPGPGVQKAHNYRNSLGL